MTAPITKVRDTRINRHIGRLRKVMELALKQGDVRCAYACHRDIIKLEGWTSVKKVRMSAALTAEQYDRKFLRQSDGLKDEEQDSETEDMTRNLQDMFGPLDEDV